MKRSEVIVLGLVGLVTAGLVLSAVVKVLGEANRLQCQLNLYHTGTMLPNYPQDVGQGRCVPGTIPHPTLPPEKRLSWIVAFKWYGGWGRGDVVGLDLAAAWDAPENAGIAGRTLPGFLCPSFAPAVRNGHALTTYIGVAGVGPDAAALPLSSPRAGYFGYDRVVTHKDIERGTSNVLMVLETAGDNGPWAAGGPATIRGLDPAEKLDREGRFGSRHAPSGIAHGLMADGSGRAFTAATDPAVLAALARLKGPEGQPE